MSVLVLLVVLATMLAACGDDDDSTSTDAGGEKATTTTAAESSASGADTVEVTMHDYAFAVSGPLTAGGTIDLKNEGNELHMMGIGKLKAGATIAQVRDALAKASPDQQGDPTGGLIEGEVGWPGGFVTPGHEVELGAAGLEAGKYALVCFLPTEGTGEPHFTKGMIAELDVAAGTAMAPKADATYTVTAGKPITGPATLSAGKHTIEITGTGDISKQEPQLVRAKSADQTPDQINDELKKYFGELEGDKPPAKGTGKAVAEYLPFAGFDLGPNKSVSFTYDFEPGTYYLAAPDTDNQEGPSVVPTELVKITVQ